MKVHRTNDQERYIWGEVCSVTLVPVVSATGLSHRNVGTSPTRFLCRIT
jgi:nuclear transcription Y subunit beta